MSDMQGQASEAVKNGKSAVAAAGEAVSSAVGNAARSAQDVAGKVREASHHAADYVRDQYDHLGERAQDAYSQAKDKAYDWEQAAEGYVQRKPLQAVLIAAGVGLVLGLLWSRRD